MEGSEIRNLRNPYKNTPISNFMIPTTESPVNEEEIKKIGKKEHSVWKASMIKKQDEKVAANDAILVLNFDKNGQENYIGGATFLEMFKAWERGKKIFLYNAIPQGILSDEINAFSPIIINGNLNKIA